MSEQQNIKSPTSSFLNMQTNILAALVLIVPALFAWIPLVGFFAWIIPMVVFIAENKSNFVRYCAAESFCIGILRLVFDVVFNSIRNTALRTAALYGSNPEYVSFWGAVQNPGNVALVMGNIIAVILTLICALAALLAFSKKLVRLPLVSGVADFMTRELRPRFKHITYNN